MKQKITFLALFSIVGFITLQIPFTKLMGSNVSFTLFDLFAPITGAFLGSWLGIVSITVMESVNIAFKGFPYFPYPVGYIVFAVRFITPLFAAWYFGTMSNKKQGSQLVLVVPIIAIAIFVAHPIGRTVWYYSLFWLIPILAYFRKDWLLARSLGATFTAHAVGGAAWIWAFNLPATVWQGLIPVVIQERLVMTLGIAGSYILIQNIWYF